MGSFVLFATETERSTYLFIIILDGNNESKLRAPPFYFSYAILTSKSGENRSLQIRSRVIRWLHHIQRTSNMHVQWTLLGSSNEQPSTVHVHICRQSHSWTLRILTPNNTGPHARHNESKSKITESQIAKVHTIGI